MLSVAIDVRRNISSAQCSIRYHAFHSHSNMNITCQPNNLCIQIQSGDDEPREINIKAFKDVFIPSSVSFAEQHFSNIEIDHKSFKYTHIASQSESVSSIHSEFRIQINSEYIADVDETLKMYVKNYLKSKIKADTPYNILCTNCSKNLAFGTISFQKVEEYCAQEVSENWFCHSHEVLNLKQASQNLYVDNFYFCVQESIIDQLLVQRHGKEYSCKACSTVIAMLDFSSKEIVKIFFDKVLLHNESALQCDTRQYKYDISMLAIWSFLEESILFSPVCKLYLQSKVNNENNCLLLWIPSKKVSQFLLQSPLPDINTEIQLKFEAVYKVLYYVGPACSDIAKSWQKDFAVDFFKVSDYMISILSESLKKSSKYVPGGESIVNGFFQGCLKPPRLYFDVKL